jgi:prepilin-type N-terminal cleavage/methylation domain-containing protein
MRRQSTKPRTAGITFDGYPHPPVQGTARRGFTLIELLVIIAIIAILAAFLLPVFAQARETARKATCLSNTKQIGLGLMMYAQDYDEALVPWYVKSGLPIDSARRDLLSWAHLIQPYVKNGEPSRVDDPSEVEPVGIMRCPSFSLATFQRQAEMPDCRGPGALDTWMPARQYWAHYGMSFRDRGGSCTQEDPHYHLPGNDVSDIQGGVSPLMALPEIRRPSDTVIVSDGFTGILKLARAGSGGKIGSAWTLVGCEGSNAHQGGGIHLFLDGRAKWIARNSERYLEQDADGCWFKRYYTIDR